jgi:hypothetical protein
VRDIFAISAFGIDIERLFNSSRDICYYRRGRLNSDIIRLFIIKLYITRFELKNDWKVIKTTINSISENIDFSDKEESDGEKDIDFLYISDDESVFALNYNFDDKDEDEKDDDNQ